MRPSRLAPWLLPLLLSAGCGSTPPTAHDRLPFHVALAVNIEDQAETRAVSPAHDPEGIPFALSTGEVAASLREVLERECFHRVTVLPDDPERAMESPGREALWIEQAADADLLLVATLTHDSQATETDGAESFSVSELPTYVIPGPVFWLDEDRTYSVGATLSFSVFDISKSRRLLEGGRWRVDDLRYIDRQVRQDDVTVCFLDRSGKDEWHLLSSFLIPGRYLDGDEEITEGSIARILVEQLAKLVVEDLRLQRMPLLRDPEQFHFYLEPAESTVVPDGAGGCQLRWTLYHEQGERKNLPIGYRIYARPDRQPLVERVLDEQEILAGARRVDRGGRSYLCFRFEEQLPLPPGAHTFQLQVDATSRDRVTRSYSFPVPPPPAPE